MNKPHATTHMENAARMARIEGQVAGIRRMIEEGRYCIDIVTQIQAVRAALQSVSRRVYRKHVEHCVAVAIRGKSSKEAEEKIEEIMRVLKRSGGA